MSLKFVRGLVPLLCLFLVITQISFAPVSASQGIAVSPSKIDFGTVGCGGSAQREVTIYNTGNNSTIGYMVAFNNVTSGALTATPSSGQISIKNNSTIIITLNVPNNAKTGSTNATMIVNTSSQQNFGGAVVLPAVAAKITYTVSGNATATPQASQTFDVGQAIGALVILMLIAAGASWLILRRKES